MSAGIASSCARARPSISSARLLRPSAPELGREPVAVENVVHDLVEEAELRREAPPGRPLGLGNLGHRKRASDRGLEEPARLQRVPPREVVVAAAHVVELAADHADRGARELVGDCRRRIREREVERLRE